MLPERNKHFGKEIPQEKKVKKNKNKSICDSIFLSLLIILLLKDYGNDDEDSSVDGGHDLEVSASSRSAFRTPGAMARGKSVVRMVCM